MRRRLLLAAVAGMATTVVAAAGVWVYLTPHLTVRALEAAVSAHDAEALAEHVDFEALRRSLKGALKARVAAEAQQKEPDKAGSGLGAYLLMNFVGELAEPLIDMLVTPEGLPILLLEAQRKAQASNTRGATGPSTLFSEMGYQTANRFAVTIRSRDERLGEMSLVLQRFGLITWKVTGVRLRG